MSFLRLFKRAAPGTPAAGYGRLYYDTTGLGTPAAPCLAFKDESGNIAMLGHLATLDYRLISVRALIAGTSYVPTTGTRAIYVQAVAGGGAGGGAATSSTQVSVGGGGGGGAFAASWLTGAAVKNPTTYALGAGGTAGAAGASGNNGGNTTWDTTVIVAAGGTGGAVMAAGSTLAAQVGGAGGAAASCTGDLKITGGLGDKGIRLSTTQGWSGNGGSPAWGGQVGADGIVAVSGGAGVNATATAYGTGGSGGATTVTSSIGGTGAPGMIIVWEFA